MPERSAVSVATMLLCCASHWVASWSWVLALLLGEAVGLGLAVAPPDSEQDREAAADRADGDAVDAHLGARHPLHDGPHAPRVDCDG